MTLRGHHALSVQPPSPKAPNKHQLGKARLSIFCKDSSKTRIPALAFPQVLLNRNSRSATACHPPGTCCMCAIRDTVFTTLLL